MRRVHHSTRLTVIAFALVAMHWADRATFDALAAEKRFDGPIDRRILGLWQSDRTGRVNFMTILGLSPSGKSIVQTTRHRFVGQTTLKREQGDVHSLYCDNELVGTLRLIGENRLSLTTQDKDVILQRTTEWEGPEGIGVPDGLWTERHSDNRSIRSTIEVVAGQKTVSKSYGSGGELLMLEEFKDGRRHGRHQIWNHAGRVLWSETYVDDRRHGTVEVWEQDTARYATLEYRNGEPFSGTYVRLYSTGATREKGNYAGGNRVGKWEQFPDRDSESWRRPLEETIPAVTPEDSRRKHSR